MQRILRSLALVLAAASSATAQTTTFSSPGAQTCATTTSSLATQSHGGVVMTPRRYASASCISSTLSTTSGASQFCIDNTQVAASEGNPLSVHVRTCASANCVGESANVVLDFTSGSKRPEGLSMLVCDVDNQHDSILVNAYANGSKVGYTYSLRGTGTAYVRAFGASPDMTFDGTAGNNSTATSAWAAGAVEISFDATKGIDSVVLRHIIWQPTGHSSGGCPSWTVSSFRWQAAAVPLATTLVDFRATATGTTAQLDWTTSETSAQAYTFTAERSADGETWSDVPGATSTTNIHFAATDRTPLPGLNHYRVRLTAADGRTGYSAAHTLRFAEKTGAVRVYPNPAVHCLYIDGAAGNVRLCNATGTVVRTASAEADASGLDLTTLPAGLYYLHILSTDGMASVEKVLKVD